MSASANVSRARRRSRLEPALDPVPEHMDVVLEVTASTQWQSLAVGQVPQWFRQFGLLWKFGIATEDWTHRNIALERRLQLDTKPVGRQV